MKIVNVVIETSRNGDVKCSIGNIVDNIVITLHMVPGGY